MLRSYSSARLIIRRLDVLTGRAQNRKLSQVNHTRIIVLVRLSYQARDNKWPHSARGPGVRSRVSWITTAIIYNNNLCTYLYTRPVGCFRTYGGKRFNPLFSKVLSVMVLKYFICGLARVYTRYPFTWVISVSDQECGWRIRASFFPVNYYRKNTLRMICKAWMNFHRFIYYKS